MRAGEAARGGVGRRTGRGQWGAPPAGALPAAPGFGLRHGSRLAWGGPGWPGEGFSHGESCPLTCKACVSQGHTDSGVGDR